MDRNIVYPRTPDGYVKMHGPSADGSGTVVNRKVPEADVMAYRAAGYTDGFKDGLQTSEEYGKAKGKGKGKSPSNAPTDFGVKEDLNEDKPAT